MFRFKGVTMRTNRTNVTEGSAMRKASRPEREESSRRPEGTVTEHRNRINKNSAELKSESEKAKRQ
jgi:hypothetical protein